MTLANQLTILRMVLAAAMFLALMAADRAWHLAALGLLTAAIITDWIDGWVARSTNSVSTFGKVADPIADKILVIGALIAMIRTRELAIPLWGVFMIIARELLVGGLRVLAGAQGQVLAAEKWGKWKMGVQSASVFLMLGILVLREYEAGPQWLERLPYPLTVLCVAATWSSAVMYVRQNRDLLEKSWK